LHWAALNLHLDTVKALVDAGADIWLRNAAGNLAVFEAERAGKDGEDNKVVAYLLKVGGAEKEEDDAQEGSAEGGEGSEDIVMTAGDTGASSTKIQDPVDDAQADLEKTTIGG